MKSWKKFVRNKINGWKNINSDWLTNFNNSNLLVVSYSQLVDDLPGQLLRLGSFFKANVSLTDINCVLENREGVFKRSKKIQETYLDSEVLEIVRKAKLEIEVLAKKKYASFEIKGDLEK